MSKVIVIGDDFGSVVGILDSDNGFVLVKQLIEDKNEDGSYNLSVRAAFINGSLSELRNYKEGQELPGRIIIKESYSPPTGKNSFTLRYDSRRKEIFGTCEYVEDDSIEDQLIK